LEFLTEDSSLRFHQPTVVLTRTTKEWESVQDTDRKEQGEKRKPDSPEEPDPSSFKRNPRDVLPVPDISDADADRPERPWYSGVMLRCPACDPEQVLASYADLQRHVTKEHGLRLGLPPLLPAATIKHECRLCGLGVVRDLVIITKHLKSQHNNMR
jgi:hypothetical protein